MTNAGCFCEKFVEAGWLVVAVLVAAFLNPFSDQVFEPDKAALLRVVVALMAAAWVIRSLDRDVLASASRSGGTSAASGLRDAVRFLMEQPIAGTALLLLLVSFASNYTSVEPRVSWWGSYQRAQGTHTLIAYLGLFFAVLAVLRRADQLERLITVLLFTSFPVALYAILQHFGMSLLKFSEAGIEARVISTLGNAIFLGAYLIMVVPLALWRLMEATAMRQRQPTRAAVASAVYVGLVVLQLAAILFTQSRGPVLGLVVELFVFVLLVAVLRRRRRWALVAVLMAVIVAGILLALNIPGLPADSIRRLPYVGRFGELAGAGARTIRARALAWETVLTAMQAEPARLALGYGAETMKAVLTRFMPAELWVLQGGGQYGTFDRAHNALFDALYANGIVGAAVYLLLYGVLFQQALRWLGFVRTRREAGAFVGLLVVGALVGLLVPWLWLRNPVLAAVGIPVGLVAGMILYLLSRVFWLPSREATTGDIRQLLMAALLAGIVGHFVETQTGIAIVATQTYFWLFAALLILLGTGRISETELTPPVVRQPVAQPVSRGRFRRSRRGRRPRDVAPRRFAASHGGSVVAMALVAAVLLGALSYAFVHGFNVPGARRPAQALVGVTWLVAGLLIVLHRHRSGADVDPPGDAAATYATAALLWVLPFALYHRVTAQTLDRLNSAYLVFVVWLLITVAGIAVALGWGKGLSRPMVRPRQIVVYAGIALLAVVLAWSVDVRRIQADVHEKIGKTAMGASLWDQALPHLERAVALQPQQDQYYIYLGGAYVEQARRRSDLAAKDVQMERARQAFEQGRALAPNDSDQTRQLGLAYRVWAEWAPDEATLKERLRQSLSYYQAAVDLNPQNPDLRLDLADAYFALGINEEAFAQFQKAVAIGAPSHLGRAYAGLGDIYLLRGEFDAALEAYRQAMELGRDRQEVLASRLRAVEQHPDDIQVRLSLALVYAAAQRRDEALRELNAAVEMASDGVQRTEVENLIASLEQ